MKTWFGCKQVDEFVWEDTHHNNEKFSFQGIMSESADSYKAKHGHSEIAYDHHAALNSFQGKKCLIIGAGESALNVEYDASNYDIVVGCNQIHLDTSPLNHIPLDVHVLGNEVQITPELAEKQKANNTLAVFEPRYNIRTGEMNQFKNWNPKTISVDIRYYGKIGAIPRIIIYMIHWGVSEIHIVGMDGMKPDDKVGDTIVHAFERTKKRKGSHGWKFFRQQYVMLWDYILHYLKPHVQFQNIGEGYPYNMLTEISKKEFPKKLSQDSV